MKFLLADTELQLIPPEMQRDRGIIKLCEDEGKDPAHCLLNYSLHREFIEHYYPHKSNRIGKLHIPYLFVRMNEESMLNSQHKMDYAIHTKEGFILERKDLAKFTSYEDFISGVEKLLLDEKRRRDINDYIDEQGYKNVVVLHPAGIRVNEIPMDSIFIIGGFAEGDYLSNLSRFRKVQLFSRELTVPAVLEIIHCSIIASGDLPYISFSSL